MPNKKRVFVISLVLFLILVLMSFAQGQADYQFTVSNNGDEVEVYELSTDLFSEYITFSENPASINAKDSKTIILTASIPCENSGTYSLNFILYAQKSKKTIKIPFDITVPSCSGYDVQFGEEIVIKAAKAVFKLHEGAYELCEDEKVSIPVLITNKDKAKSFKFELDGVGFAKLSGKRLFLNQNQRGVSYIALEPKDKGNYSFNLNIITDKIDKIPIDLKIKECVGVYFTADNLTLCGCELYSYDFLVGNQGNKKAEFGLELEGPEWLSLGLNQNFELEPNGVIGVALNIDAPCRESETHDANIIAYLADQKDVRAEDSVSITIVEDCFETRIETEDIVSIDYNGITLPVKVTSYGAEQMVYSVILEGPEWIKLDNYTVSLEPGDEKTIELDIKPSESIEEGDYEIKINLASEKASYSKDVEVKLKKETQPVEEITEFYDSYSKDIWTGALVVLVIIVLLFLVLSAKKIKKIKVRTKKKIKKALLRLFLVILVLAILGYLIKLFGKFLWHWITWFRYYIYTVPAVVVIIYLISRHINKKKELKKQKKIEEKKRAEKSIRRKKPKKKYLKYFLIVFFVLILIGIFVYFSIYYNLLQYVIRFLLIYYPYIIAGIIILVILILLLRFSTRKKKNKKRKKTKS